MNITFSILIIAVKLAFHKMVYHYIFVLHVMHSFEILQVFRHFRTLSYTAVLSDVFWYVGLNSQILSVKDKNLSTLTSHVNIRFHVHKGGGMQQISVKLYDTMCDMRL